MNIVKKRIFVISFAMLCIETEKKKINNKESHAT